MAQQHAQYPPLIQFVLFAMVGCAAAVGHYGVLIALAELLAAPPVLASAAGFAVGGVISYLLNYGHVFHSHQEHLPTAARFLAVTTVGMGLNTAIMWLLVQRIGLHYLLAQVTATALVMIWSFSANRYWTFNAGSSRA